MSFRFTYVHHHIDSYCSYMSLNMIMIMIKHILHRYFHHLCQISLERPSKKTHKKRQKTLASVEPRDVDLEKTRVKKRLSKGPKVVDFFLDEILIC